MTRSKNTINIMVKNLMDFCLGALLYWAIGYRLMHGENGTSFIGWSTGYLFMQDGLSIAADSSTAFSNSAAWCFQMVFVATIATIVSAALAGASTACPPAPTSRPCTSGRTMPVSSDLEY